MSDIWKDIIESIRGTEQDTAQIKAYNTKNKCYVPAS